MTFIDELLSALILKHGESKVMSAVEFIPPFEKMYLEQIQRGIRLRTSP